MSKVISLLFLSITLAFALACGGGGSSSGATSSTTSQVRLASKPGDTLAIYSLGSGNMVEQLTFSSTGSVSSTLSTSESYVLKLSIPNVEDGPILETILTNAELKAKASLTVYMNAATTWVTHKVMSAEPDESNIVSLITSVSHGSSIASLSLDALSDRFSESELAQIKFYALVNGMVIRSADLGDFTGNWGDISDNLMASFSLDTTSAEVLFTKASELATILKDEIKLPAQIGYEQLDAALQTLLGSDADAFRMLAGVQEGDVAATLSALNGGTESLTATALYDLGVAALVKEDMLEAYQYFAAAVSLNPSNVDARFLLATTRVMTLSLKGTREAKKMLSILNLEFDFLDNDHLRNDDGDDIDAIDTTLYEDPNDVSSVFNYAELRTYLENVVLTDIAQSIADLVQINDAATSIALEITPAMQGKIDEDENDLEILPTESILIDRIDVDACIGSLELMRFNILALLGQDLEVNSKNATGAGMKDMLIEGGFSNKLYLEGTSIFNVTGDSFLSSLTFSAGYPDEVILAVDAPNGDKNKLDVKALNENEISNFEFNYPDLTITEKDYKIEGETFVQSDGNVIRRNFHGAFEGNTFSSFQATVDKFIAPSMDGPFTFVSSNTLFATKDSGDLTFHSTYQHIDGMDFLDYIEADANFATLSGNYNERARNALSNALTAGIGVLNALQAETGDRIDHFVDNLETLERDDGTMFSDSEVDSFEVFLSGVKEALFGTSSVNPAFLSNDKWSTQNLDLSGFFTTDLKELFVDSNGDTIASTYNNPNTSDFLDDTVLNTGSLFGVTPAEVSGANLADVYAEFLSEADDWLTLAKPSTNTNTQTSTASTAATTLTGSASFDKTFIQVGNTPSGTSLNNVSLSGSSTPGQVTLSINSQSPITGYVNGLGMYFMGAFTENSVSKNFSSVIIFTDSSMQSAVQLLTVIPASGDTYMEVSKLNLSTGSLTIGNFSNTLVTGSTVISHLPQSFGGETSTAESFTMTANGSSLITVTPTSSNDVSYNLSMYGYSFVGAHIDTFTGFFSVLIGVFSNDQSTYTALEAGYDGGSSGWIDAALGTVTSGNFLIDHHSAHAYGGSTLTVSNLYTGIQTSSELTGSNVVITSSSEVLSATAGADSAVGMLMGPVMFLGSQNTNEHSMNVFIFDDVNYSNYYGPATGYDSVEATPVYAEFQRGSKLSGNLTRN